MTHLAVPYIGALGCLQDEAVVGIEGSCDLLHLHRPGVELVGAPHVEQPSAIHIIGVHVSPAWEGGREGGEGGREGGREVSVCRSLHGVLALGSELIYLTLT